MPTEQPPEKDQDLPYHRGDENRPNRGHHRDEVIDEAKVQAYWGENLKLLGQLLVIWFVVSFGLGILLVGPLNEISFFGFKMGFWWAQQGSIYVFIALIFYYVFKMARIERAHGVDDDA